jgi:hypothetical protein
LWILYKGKKEYPPTWLEAERAFYKLSGNEAAMKKYIGFHFLLLLSLMGRAQTFEPKGGTLGEVNQSFHEAYNGWVEAQLATFGTTEHPVMILTGDSMVFLFRGQRLKACIIPFAYHELKAIDHLALGLFSLASSWKEGPMQEQKRTLLKTYPPHIEGIQKDLEKSHIGKEMLSNQRKILLECQQYISQLLTGKQNQYAQRDTFAHHISPLLLANAEEAAKLQVGLLHEQVGKWRGMMDSLSFQSVYVVVGSSHQARYRQLTLQYFDKVFQENSSTTALTENHVIAAEGIYDEKKCLSLLARHLIDQQIGLSFFGDKYRMQRDLLSDGAAKYIDPLFSNNGMKK